MGMMDRRRFITGITGLIAAPAIVPFASLMPIRGVVMPVNPLLQEYIRSRLFEPYTGSIVTGLPGVSWWWPRQNTAQC